MPATGPGYVRSLIDIQLINGSFVGSYRDYGSNTIHNFSFNAGDRSIQTTDTGIPIDFGAVQDRVHSDPTSYWRLYERYRHRWPAIVFLDLIALGGGAIIFGLRKFWVIMQQRAASAMTQ